MKNKLLLNAWMNPPKVEHNSFFEMPEPSPKSTDLITQLTKRGTYIEYKYTADGNVLTTRRAFQTPLSALEKQNTD